MTVVSAMGQMFYSLSIAMGILITFGSYMKKDTSIEKSTENVEIFDTAIAIMAGLMIIPAVFAFSGGNAETLKSGPALMFITIPKVFANMGFGTAIGVVFFLLFYDQISVPAFCSDHFDQLSCKCFWNYHNVISYMCTTTKRMADFSAILFI